VPVLFVLITKIAYGRKLKRLQEEAARQQAIDDAIIKGRV